MIKIIYLILLYLALHLNNLPKKLKQYVKSSILNDQFFFDALELVINSLI